MIRRDAAESAAEALSRRCTPTPEHVGPKWSPVFHADGIAVTASERTMGLPAVVLQSALQTATTQPSVSMRGPQRAGPQGAWQLHSNEAHWQIRRSKRAVMPRVAWSACGAASWTRSLRDGDAITAAYASTHEFALKHGECSLHCAERGVGASPIDNRRCLREIF